MSISSSSNRIHYKIWLIVYVRWSKLPKKAKNCQILRFLAILVVQNVLTGGEFCKKWLMFIKLHGLSSKFSHKKWFQFDCFYCINVLKFKISVRGRFENDPPWSQGGRPTKIFFSKKFTKQYFRKSHWKRWWLKHA